MIPTQPDLPGMNLRYVMGSDWELIRRPADEPPIEWRWNSYKPLFGRYLFRWRRGDYDWAPVPAVEPLIAPAGVHEHTFEGCFTINTQQRRELKLGKFLKQAREQGGFVVAGGSDYGWEEGVADRATVHYTLKSMEPTAWEYIAVPVVQRFVLSWGWKHQVREAWYRELIPLLISRLFTRHGGGANVSSVAFSDEPLYIKADFMIFRRPRNPQHGQVTL